NVHVADLEARTFAVESPGTKCAEPAFVGKLGQGIRLIDDLAELAASKEILDGRRDALRVDERPRSHVGLLADAHAFLNGAAQLEKPFAQLIRRELVNRAKPAIAEMVDVVKVAVTAA